MVYFFIYYRPTFGRTNMEVFILGREVKEYSVRKKEILDTAQDLFLKKGYKTTSVRDIINEIGIAKGTFYHYFKSKEQLMKEMVNKKIIDKMIEIYSSAAGNNELTALEKLDSIFKGIWDWRVKNKELNVLRSVFFEDKDLNNDIWYYLRKNSIQQAAPILADIIKQGVNEGDFVNDYPMETGEILISLIFDLKEVIGRHLKDSSKADIIRKVEAFNFSIEKILGVKQGSLMIYDKKKFKNLIN